MARGVNYEALSPRGRVGLLVGGLVAGKEAVVRGGGRGWGRSWLDGATHASWAGRFDRVGSLRAACKVANRGAAGCSVDVEMAAPTVKDSGKLTHLT